LSENLPEKIFTMLCVASATPSIAPTNTADPPSTVVMNAGMNGKIMSEDKSFRKLTVPIEITFFESPNAAGFFASSAFILVRA